MSSSRRTINCGLFDELAFRGAGSLSIMRGPEPAITVTGPEDLVDRVVVKKRGLRLVVSLRIGPNPMALLQGFTDNLSIVAITDSISKVTAQGFASVILGNGPQEPLGAEELLVINSGAGTIRGDVSTVQLSIRLRGAGRVELAGDTRRLDARLAGLGSMDCDDLVAQTARVAVNSMGSASVMVLDEFTAVANGMGSIRYRGTAVLTRRGGNRSTRIEHLE